MYAFYRAVRVVRIPKNRLRHMHAAALLLCASLLAPCARAQDANTNAALFKLQSTVQRLTQENASLQEQLAAREAELSALRTTQPSASPRAAPAADRAAEDARAAAATARYQQNVSALNAGLDRARAQIAEIAGKYRELAGTLRSVEDQRTRFAQDGDRHLQRALACEQQNSALHTLASEALDHYENKGLWDVVLAAEPFTQVQRVRLENQVDAYRQKLDELYASVGGAPQTMPERAAPPPSAASASEDFPGAPPAPTPDALPETLPSESADSSLLHD